jgi:glycosidase
MGWRKGRSICQPNLRTTPDSAIIRPAYPEEGSPDLNRLRATCLLLFATAALAPLWAQEPVIDSIDPPDWFVQLPDPMLLIHGSGLAQAHFSLHGQGVTLTRTQLAPNGHWAFLWLKTAGAAPQNLRITASNQQGSASHSWQLSPRTEPAGAHRGFTPADLIYLIMTDRFADGNPANNQPAAAVPNSFDPSKPHAWHGGDLAGIEQHIDYLQSLGVTALWTTPVADNSPMPDSYHGYAATNLYAVDPHFGTLDDYRHLSTALHARGIKLVIDLVPNHIGVLHPWVADPPAPNWLHGTVAHHTLSGGDFSVVTDPHAAPAVTRPFTDGWFVDAMPDLNQDNPLVAQYLIQNALWWIETAKIDAIRLDTFPYVGRAFWHDFHAALHKAYPHLTSVGEVFNGNPVVTSYFAGGRERAGIDTGLDTPFDFPVYFAVRDVLAGNKPMTDLEAVLRQDTLYPHPERLVHFFGNHDTTRFFTEAGSSLPRLREALGLLATLRGTPELYSGDEIAMPGGADPDNRRDFPGGFPSSPQPSAFTAATRTPDQQSTFTYTSSLFATRKSHPALQGAPQQDLFVDSTAFVFLRTEDLSGCTPAHPHDTVLAAINKDAAPRVVTLQLPGTALAACTQFKPLSPANTGAASLSNTSVQLTLPADAFVLFDVR